MPKSEFCITFTCHKILIPFFIFFQPSKNVKASPISQAGQKQAVGQTCPMELSSLTPDINAYNTLFCLLASNHSSLWTTETHAHFLPSLSCPSKMYIRPPTFFFSPPLALGRIIAYGQHAHTYTYRVYAEYMFVESVGMRKSVAFLCILFFPSF